MCVVLIQEGNLFEQGVVLFVGFNLDMLVLMENICFFVIFVVFQFVEMNSEVYYCCLMLDVDMGGCRGYMLDVFLVYCLKWFVYVVDIKWMFGLYELICIVDFKF